MMRAGGSRDHAHGLDREDRQDTGHQVEDEAADKGKECEREEACRVAPCPGRAGAGRGEAGRIVKDGALFGGEFVACPRAVRLFHDEDAFERAVRRIRAGGREGERGAVSAEAGGLACRMAYLVGEGKEAEGRVTGEAGRSAQAELPGRSGRVETGLAGISGWRPGDPVGNHRAMGRIGNGLADIQHKRDVSIFRHADVFTDEIISNHVQPDRAAGGCRDHQRERQDDLVAVAVIHDFAVNDGQERRNGPDKIADGASGNITRIAVDEPWRQARIAGIAPVDVPVGVEIHLQRGLDGFAGHDTCAFGDQFDTGMAAINRGGERGHRGAKDNRREQAAEDTDHVEAFIGSIVHMPAIGRRMKALAHS